MKTLLAILVSAGLGAAVVGIIIHRQQAAVREAQAAEFAKREAELAAEKARLEQALATARGRTVTIETTAPAAPPQTIEVIKAPSPREALERLKQLRVAAGPGQVRTLRLVVHELETLVAAGTNALPPIREYLALNQDVSYDPNAGAGGKGRSAFDPRTSTEFLVPSSLCLGLFDVVRQIGGPEAEKILADTLSTTARGLEVLYLAQVLQQMAPNKYRDLATGVARDLLAHPVAKGAAPLDKLDQSYLYSVLTMFNDVSYAGSAQAQLVSPEGKVDKAALKYLQGALGEQTLAIAQQTWNDPRLGMPEKEPLARVALAYLGLNPQAEPLFKTAINDPAMPSEHRRNLIEDLNQDGFANLRSLTAKDVPLIQSRLRFIQQNAPNALDPVNAAAFAEAAKDLLKMLERASAPQTMTRP